MGKWLTGFSMCWGMFCAIPNPIRRWDENCRRQMLLCLPLLGIVLGGLWAALGALLVHCSVPAAVRAACMAAAPWCLTGFIHLDGFMDCSDAVLSRREQARRREILKDSHVGSFAVISMVLLAMGSFALWDGDFPAQKLWALPGICGAVRAVSAGAVLGLKPLRSSEYRAMEQHPSALWGAILWLAVCIGGGCFLAPAWAAAPAAAIVSGGVIWALRRNLGGMCGDISGAAITLGELAGAAALLLF